MVVFICTKNSPKQIHTRYVLKLTWEPYNTRYKYEQHALAIDTITNKNDFVVAAACKWKVDATCAAA